MNDEHLAELCKKGDKQAFEELILRYYVPLQKFLYKYVPDRRICEDLTHDVMIKLIENIEKYRPVWGAKFSTWLFKIAYNTCMNYLKKHPEKKECAWSDTLKELSQSDNVPELVASRIEAELLHSKLEEMSLESKSLLILRYYHDFSYADIGRILDMATVRVKWRMHQSLKQLKALLDT